MKSAIQISRYYNYLLLFFRIQMKSCCFCIYFLFFGKKNLLQEYASLTVFIVFDRNWLDLKRLLQSSKSNEQNMFWIELPFEKDIDTLVL